MENFWTRASQQRRAALIVGVGFIFALFVFLTVWTMRDDYQVLFADLDPQDAGQMIAELDRLKTPYKLADNGATILVDRDAVYKTRLKLMGKGMMLKGNVGFELFNNTDYGTTEFAQKINFQRALQGELERTIMAIDEVKFARVHLVLPERGLLKKQNGQAKASISVVMKGDSQLSTEQVTGIQRLVAASVPDIEAAAVTVLDQKGVALTPNVVGDASGASTTAKMQVKKDIESYLAKKVSGLLDGALGPGKALVSVDVTINYDEIKVTKEDMLPAASRSADGGGAILRRRQSEHGMTPYSEESKSGKTQSTDTSTRDTGNVTRTVDVEFQNGRRVEQIVSEPGNIRRISVGIFVPAAFSNERLAQLREVIGMAVGLNAARGDAIAIQSVELVSAGPQKASLSPIASAEPPSFDSVSQAPKHRFNDSGPIVIWLLGVAALIVTIGIAALFLSRRNSSHARDMSSEERERMLEQISEWLNADSVKKAPQKL
ncbi:MAG: flagellar basal-body MS-ring/collar protein FliF [Pseudomonadota bacterium]